MKNIYLISTEKPSRLVRFFSNKYHYSKEILPIEDEEQYQNVYITNNEEEIKEGDWVIYKDSILRANKSKIYSIWINFMKNGKKIILTNDQELIKEGVQAIEDEFLEWWINNTSCEFVEVVKLESDGCHCYYNKFCQRKTLDYKTHCRDGDGVSIKHYYKIIIPQQKLEQEIKLNKILSEKPSKFWEESDKRFENREIFDRIDDRMCRYPKEESEFWKHYKIGVLDGLKWQQEKDKKLYSEEEVGELVYSIIGEYGKHYGIMVNGSKLNDLFEQLKKK